MLQLYRTWVTLGKNDLITLKSGYEAESTPELKILGVHPLLLY